jgi:hypothetical protein
LEYRQAAGKECLILHSNLTREVEWSGSGRTEKSTSSFFNYINRKTQFMKTRVDPMKCIYTKRLFRVPRVVLAVQILMVVAAPAFSVSMDVQEDKTRYGVVYYEESRFAGFPANEGAWVWGDEALVSFMVTDYAKAESGHNQVSGAPRHIFFARSLDGGRTWKTEPHSNVSLADHAREPELYRDIAPDLQRPRPLETPIDFSNPDLALKIRDDQFYVSQNRGKTWTGPFEVPDLGVGTLSSRTSYLPTGPASCLFFFSAEKQSTAGKARGRSFVAETTDGGLTFRFVGWMGEDTSIGVDPSRDVYSSMPAVVRLKDGSLLATLRRRIGGKNRWTDIVSSSDEGQSWTFLSTLERGVNNPMSLVALDDGRVVAIYGNRLEGQLGIVAKVTADGGHRWSEEYIIRANPACWDMGYCRAALLPDGRILAMYYFNTEELPEMHISYSVWMPPSEAESMRPPVGKSMDLEADVICLNDGFDDKDRDNQALPGSAQWIGSTSGNLRLVAAGEDYALQNSSDDGTQHAVAYFTPSE